VGGDDLPPEGETKGPFDITRREPVLPGRVRAAHPKPRRIKPDRKRPARRGFFFAPFHSCRERNGGLIGGLLNKSQSNPMARTDSFNDIVAGKTTEPLRTGVFRGAAFGTRTAASAVSRTNVPLAHQSSSHRYFDAVRAQSIAKAGAELKKRRRLGGHRRHQARREEIGERCSRLPRRPRLTSGGRGLGHATVNPRIQGSSNAPRENRDPMARWSGPTSTVGGGERRRLLNPAPR